LRVKKNFVAFERRCKGKPSFPHAQIFTPKKHLKKDAFLLGRIFPLRCDFIPLRWPFNPLRRGTLSCAMPWRGGRRWEAMCFSFSVFSFLASTVFLRG
jgi:hypothetical protein